MPYIVRVALVNCRGKRWLEVSGRLACSAYELIVFREEFVEQALPLLLPLLLLLHWGLARRRTRELFRVQSLRTLSVTHLA